MMALFKKHRIEVVSEKGESIEEARQRTEKSAWDSEIVLLLQMKKTEWVTRTTRESYCEANSLLLRYSIQQRGIEIIC